MGNKLKGYGRVIFQNNMAISTKQPITTNDINKYSEIQIVQSPFNPNRQCLFKPIVEGTYLAPLTFTNFYNLDDEFTFHFQFRFAKSPRWIEGFSIDFVTADDENTIKNTSFRLKEDWGQVCWFNTYAVGYNMQADTNYDCLIRLKNGLLMPYIDGVHYNDYNVTNIKRITSISLWFHNFVGNWYNHNSDLYYDDIFCCFGKDLYTEDYKPDYENYYMFDEFKKYNLYQEDNKNVYSI